MSKVFSEIWKYLDRLKGKWGFIGNLSLRLLILSLSICYLAWRFSSIIKSGEKQIDTAVIAISAIIILLPFLSEIELFGVKFKKEIEQTKNELNNRINELKFQISNIDQSQKQVIYNFLNSGSLSKEDLQRLESKIENNLKSEKPVGEEKNIKIDQKIVKFFDTRATIAAIIFKKGLTYIIDPNTSNNESLPTGLLDRIEFVCNKYSVPSDIKEIVKEMINISDDVHEGREIAQNQIDFVVDNAEDIITYLKNIEYKSS